MISTKITAISKVLCRVCKSTFLSFWNGKDHSFIDNETETQHHQVSNLNSLVDEELKHHKFYAPPKVLAGCNFLMSRWCFSPNPLTLSKGKHLQLFRKVRKYGAGMKSCRYLRNIILLTQVYSLINSSAISKK